MMVRPSKRVMRYGLSGNTNPNNTNHFFSVEMKMGNLSDWKWMCKNISRAIKSIVFPVWIIVSNLKSIFPFWHISSNTVQPIQLWLQLNVNMLLYDRYKKWCPEILNIQRIYTAVHAHIWDCVCVSYSIFLLFASNKQLLPNSLQTCTANKMKSSERVKWK